jgi:hypothetical protein
MVFGKSKKQDKEAEELARGFGIQEPSGLNEAPLPPHRKRTLIIACLLILGNELCERLAYYGALRAQPWSRCAPAAPPQLQRHVQPRDSDPCVLMSGDHGALLAAAVCVLSRAWLSPLQACCMSTLTCHPSAALPAHEHPVTAGTCSTVCRLADQHGSVPEEDDGEGSRRDGAQSFCQQLQLLPPHGGCSTAAWMGIRTIPAAHGVLSAAVCHLTVPYHAKHRAAQPADAGRN